MEVAVVAYVLARGVGQAAQPRGLRKSPIGIAQRLLPALELFRRGGAAGTHSRHRCEGDLFDSSHSRVELDAEVEHRAEFAAALLLPDGEIHPVLRRLRRARAILQDV